MVENEEENKVTESKAPTSTFTKKIGKTTYEVAVHFSEISKETLDDKIKRMLLADVQRELSNMKI